MSDSSAVSTRHTLGNDAFDGPHRFRLHLRHEVQRDIGNLEVSKRLAKLDRMQWLWPRDDRGPVDAAWSHVIALDRFVPAPAEAAIVSFVGVEVRLQAPVFPGRGQADPGFDPGLPVVAPEFDRLLDFGARRSRIVLSDAVAALVYMRRSRAREAAPIWGSRPWRRVGQQAPPRRFRRLPPERRPDGEPFRMRSASRRWSDPSRGQLVGRLMLDFEAVSGFDFSAVNVLARFLQSANAAGVHVVLRALSEQLRSGLERNLPPSDFSALWVEPDSDRALERSEEIVIAAWKTNLSRVDEQRASLLERAADDLERHLDRQVRFEELMDELRSWLNPCRYAVGETLAGGAGCAERRPATADIRPGLRPGCSGNALSPVRPRRCDLAGRPFG